jgi:hypothetical protein
MADIKIPGVGPVDKKKALAIGAVTIGAIGIVVIRRKNAAAAAAATPAATDTTDDSTVDPSIDPETGIPYADEQSSGFDSSGAFDEGAGDTGLSSNNFDAAGYPIGSAADLAWQAQQDGTSVSGTTTAITTNSQWLTAAEAQLGDTSAITTALTKVLGGVAVTSDQQNIFMEAVGLLGAPPGGYPPINLTSTSQAPVPPTGTTSAANVTVPNVVGQSANNALAALQAKGLVGHIGTVRNPKDTYTVNSQTPGAGKSVKKGSTVDLGIKTP